MFLYSIPSKPKPNTATLHSRLQSQSLYRECMVNAMILKCKSYSNLGDTTWCEQSDETIQLQTIYNIISNGNTMKVWWSIVAFSIFILPTSMCQPLIRLLILIIGSFSLTCIRPPQKRKVLQGKYDYHSLFSKIISE